MSCVVRCKDLYLNGKQLSPGIVNWRFNDDGTIQFKNGTSLDFNELVTYMNATKQGYRGLMDEMEQQKKVIADRDAEICKLKRTLELSNLEANANLRRENDRMVKMTRHAEILLIEKDDVIAQMEYQKGLYRKITLERDIYYAKATKWMDILKGYGHFQKDVGYGLWYHRTIPQDIWHLVLQYAPLSSTCVYCKSLYHFNSTPERKTIGEFMCKACQTIYYRGEFNVTVEEHETTNSP